MVGGGIGGLASAVRLAAAGARVTLLERASALGGKLRQVEVGGRAIDAGPTVVTMPHVFEELFAVSGSRLADHVTLRPLDPACRHFSLTARAWTSSARPRHSSQKPFVHCCQ